MNDKDDYDKDDYDWGREAEQALVQGVLTGGAVTGPTPPECDNHVEIQHQDGRPPWCRTCGWNHGMGSTGAADPQKIVNLRRE